ncbi:MAG TPA: TPM domain-containing protein [Candidatus Sulfopaludibacter sp.]|nr:TPM domain-containing protein [Candidatus Sulfopaludibacter sp.]
MTQWLRLAVALMCVASAGRAVDWKTLRPQGCVSDFASVVDAASKARIEAYCGEVEKAAGAEMALVTISSLEGEPVAEVAGAIFRAWGVGQRSKSGGVLLLLATGDRRSHLEVGPRLQPFLPESLDSSILREMRPALRKRDHGDALMAAAQTIGGAIAAAKHVVVRTPLPRRARPTAADWIPWPAIAGGALLAGWLMLRGGTHGYSGLGGGGFLPGLFPGSKMRRDSWGSRGSGGFGGFDSGDGFGGFGGADSGGGRPWSDW